MTRHALQRIGTAAALAGAAIVEVCAVIRVWDLGHDALGVIATAGVILLADGAAVYAAASKGRS